MPVSMVEQQVGKSYWVKGVRMDAAKLRMDVASALGCMRGN